MRRPAQIILHRSLVSNIFISPDESEMTDPMTILRVSSADCMFNMIIVDITPYYVDKSAIEIDLFLCFDIEMNRYMKHLLYILLANRFFLIRHSAPIVLRIPLAN